MIAPVAALVLALAGPATAQVPEPDGFRMGDYRAPVPDTLAGATVVDDAQAAALWRDGAAVFVDAMPRAVRPAALPEGVIWRDRPRDSIPGAVWLANAGHGALHPDTDARVRAALAEATGGDRGRPLVVFCMADCWMSWNLAKRAVEDYGYTAVHWYPDGTDGWAFEDLPLAPVAPWPGF